MSFHMIICRYRNSRPASEAYTGDQAKPTIPICSRCLTISVGSKPTTENWKFIRDDINGRRELYNLKDDAEEMKNVVNEYPDLVSELDTVLNDHLLSMNVEDKAQKGTTAFDKAIEAQLKSLGYM